MGSDICAARMGKSSSIKRQMRKDSGIRYNKEVNE